jgi:hypothetical protein
MVIDCVIEVKFSEIRRSEVHPMPGFLAPAMIVVLSGIRTRRTVGNFILRRNLNRVTSF